MVFEALSCRGLTSVDAGLLDAVDAAKQAAAISVVMMCRTTASSALRIEAFAMYLIFAALKNVKLNVGGSCGQRPVGRALSALLPTEFGGGPSGWS